MQAGDKTKMNFKTSVRKAFTLIELLVVIAITGLLLTIIVFPVIQSVKLVHLAESYSDAQTSARHLLDAIGREISNSAGVRDNSGDSGAIDVVVNSGPGSPNPTVTVRLPYSKLDILKPAQGEPQIGPNGPEYIDPSTGRIDPTLTASKGQVVLPVVPGTTIIRYFVCLRDPFYGGTSPKAGLYNNPYNSLLGQGIIGAQDNLFVLRRAEIQPYTFSQNGYVANTSLFATDASGRPILDDPDFMIPDGTPAKAARIANWISDSVIQTEISHYDMIEPVYNKYSQKLAYVTDAAGDFVPQLVPLLQFRPTRVGTETVQGMNTLRLGDENDSSLTIGSDVFRTSLGGWTQAEIHLWPTSGNNNPATAPQSLGINLTRSDGSVGFSIYSTLDGVTPQTEFFDVNSYLSGLGGSSYPFTVALTAANTRSNWSSGFANNVDAYVPYYYDSQEGKLYASFGINEVGLNKLAPNPNDPTGSRPNLPLSNEGTMTTPENPGQVSTFAGPAFTINDAFNTAYNDYPELRANLHRYIDLRVTPNEDGTFGPLFPFQSNWPYGTPNVTIQGLGMGFPQASITAGSEVVYGPDALPGPDYGQQVRYTRVAQGDPGPNQYKINYGSLTPPTDYTLLGANATDLTGFKPAVYDPTNPVSALLEAQYEPGYITLNSDPNTPLPNTVPFKVSYRFQMSQSRDAFSVDYDTRQVMSLLVTIRNFSNQDLTPNPQTVTLKTTVDVRNFVR